MDTAAVDHAHASSTPIDDTLQYLSECTPGLLPVEPVKVNLFIRENLAAPQPSQMSTVDAGSDPLETFRLVA